MREAGPDVTSINVVDTQFTKDQLNLIRKLPSPCTYNVTNFGDSQLILTEVETTAGVRPFFFEVDSFLRMQNFVKRSLLRNSNNPEFLVLTGPVKSGKSETLSRILPPMIAGFYSSGETIPFIVKHSFVVGQNVESAVNALFIYLARVAKAELGIVVDVPDDPSKTLGLMAVILGDLSQCVKEKGGRLWLLIDEAQAPLLASKTVEEVHEFTNHLKCAIKTCHDYGGRVVLTGSGMVTFLNEIRCAKPNGYMLFTSATFVSLGGSPSTSTAPVLAASILQSYSYTWPDDIKSYVTPKRVVDELQRSGRLLNCRPALIATVADFVGTSLYEPLTPAQLLENTLASTKAKIRGESLTDIMTAFRHLEGNANDREMLKCLHALASGNPDSLSRIDSFSHQKIFLSLLCDNTESGLRLVPPYASLILECLNEAGDVICKRGKSEVFELGESLRSLLVFFEEGTSKNRFDEPMKQAISNSVLETLYKNGVGVDDKLSFRKIETLEDLMLVPAISSLLTSSSNTQVFSEYIRKVEENKKSESIGYEIVRWIRNVACHSEWASTELTKMGIPPAMIDKICTGAKSALLNQRITTFGEFFQGGEFGIPVYVKAKKNKAKKNST